MYNLIYKNAYGILGLLPDAETEDIKNRKVEIAKFLFTGNVPKYDFDFDFYRSIRNKEYIETALNDASDPFRKNYHRFFRIYAKNEDELEKLISLNRDFNIKGIINYYESVEIKDFEAKKNTNILFLLLLLNKTYKNNKEEALYNKTIEIWHQILADTDSIKKYDDNEAEFSLGLKKELTKIYFDIARLRGLNETFNEFTNELGINIEYNQPQNNTYDLYKKLTDIAHFLENYTPQKEQYLAAALFNIKESLNSIINLGLYDKNETLLIRNRLANSLCSVAQKCEIQKEAIELNNIALKIANI